MSKPYPPAFRFFAKFTPDGGADPAASFARWSETAEALIVLEQDGKPDRNEETHNQARRLFSFDALIGREAAGMGYADLALAYMRKMRFKRGFPLATPPRWEGFDAFLLRLTAALDRFELPTDAWRQYKRQFSNDLQTDAPADVWRRYGVPRPPA